MHGLVFCRSHDSYDLHVGLAAYANRLSYRVSCFEEIMRIRFVDDCDVRRACSVSLVKITALEPGNSQGLEEARGDCIKLRKHILVRTWMISGRIEIFTLMAAGHKSGIDEACSVHAR